jgi:hypothetical protein
MKSPVRLVGVTACLLLATTQMKAQLFPDMQFYRPSDKTGINIFETTKDTSPYDGMKFRLGGGFTQQWQSLQHENTANPYWRKFNGGADSINYNALYGITPGFNTASANLLIDVQLEDGVRLNLTTYLATRRHQDTWVKGGYIQFDRLRFLGSEFIDNIMEYLTIKIGHTEINYGDAHFRRTDGGLSIYNPFAENYIVDAFTTEIGGDVTFQHPSGLLAVLGLTNGEIKGAVDPVTPGTGDTTTTKSPSIYFKAGFDKKFGDAFRVRLTGSGYLNDASPRNTLFNGDRAGSYYFLVMESQAANYSSTSTSASSMKPTTTAQAISGRYDPNFSRSIQAFVINGLLQFSRFELFLNYDIASGRTANEVEDRSMSQLAGDLIVRLGSNDQYYLAGRYNLVNTETLGILDANGAQAEQQISRIAFAAGWFLTKSILIKGEYVIQEYKDFPITSIFNGGKFSGVVFEAAVGF